MRWEARESSKENDVVKTTEPGGGGDWVRTAASLKIGGVALVPVDEATESEEAVVTPVVSAAITGWDGSTMGLVGPVVGAVVGAVEGAASKVSASSAIVAANKSSNDVPEASSSSASGGGW